MYQSSHVDAQVCEGKLTVSECYKSLQLFQNNKSPGNDGLTVEFYLSNRPQVSMGYFQVNALSERIIRIYLHEFTNNERENSIPHEAAECGIENFEFIVSERVPVNPANSRAMRALTFLLFKLNTLQTKIVKL